MPTPSALSSLESAVVRIGADVRRLADILGIELSTRPLLPSLTDLQAGAVWPGGSITASATAGDPAAVLYLPAGNVYAGSGLPIVDYAMIEFAAPVIVSAIDLTVPSFDARPDIIAVDAAQSATGPWTAVLTHDPGSITATQRISVADVSATHWRISVSVPTGQPPAVIALQLHGRAA